MSASALLKRIVDQLDAAGIPFMLTGSFAAAVHGAGRATMDIDLVIDPSRAQLHDLVRSLDDPAFYLSADAAVEAFRLRTMFNVIESATGWKADLIMRKSREFSRSEFARRQPLEFDGIHLWTVTPEDLIIAKLEWHTLSDSARQLDDAIRLVRVVGETLDFGYIERWVGELGLELAWHATREAATRA